MKTYIQPIAGLVFGLLLVTGLSAPRGYAQELEREDGGYRATVTNTFSVQPGGTFDIGSVSGAIDIEAWDQNEVQIEEEIRFRGYDRNEALEYLQDNATRYEQDGNSISVRARRHGNSSWRRGVQYSYEVRVPRQFNIDAQTSGGPIEVTGVTGSVDGKTSGGPVDMHDITGRVFAATSGGPISLENIDGEAEARTSGGPIEIENVSGPLVARTSGGGIEIVGAGGDTEAMTSGGEIRVENVQGALVARTAGGDIEVTNVQNSVEAETSGGDVELMQIGGAVRARTAGGDIEGIDIGGAINAETAAGDIEFANVRGGVNARTSVGDIEVQMTMDDFEGNYATTLETTHGDIVLMIPADMPATIDAEVRVEGRGYDRNDIYSEFPLSREVHAGPRDGLPGALRSMGDINGGGPTMELQTRGGSIRIEKTVDDQ